jgi:hypothetical protein
MGKQAWIIAIAFGVVVILLSIVNGGVGPLGTTGGVVLGLIMIIAGFLVRRMRGRKAPAPPRPRA